MSSTQPSAEVATEAPAGGQVEMKLEVVVVPVSDVERAKVAAAGDQDTHSGSLTRQEDSPMDVATLAGLLHETAEHHDPYEKSAPEHNWWDWYAAYLNARLEGSGSEEASRDAGIYMEGVLGAR